jgi:hypothetical protein
LNWGFHDHPESREVSQLTGMLTVDGAIKAWGREFSALSRRLGEITLPPRAITRRPDFDWDEALTSTEAGQAFRERYYRGFSQRRRPRIEASD